jgi:hypothetical protein
VQQSEVNALTLLAVLIAAGLASTISPEGSVFTQPLVGVVLLIVLFSYDREGHRNSGQSLAFAAVAGCCAARVLFPPLAVFLPVVAMTLPLFSIVWVLSTLILWAVDISRMGRRTASQAPISIPAVVPIREEPIRPQPVRVEPAPVRPTSATSLFSHSPTPTTPTHPAEAISTPVEEISTPASTPAEPPPPPLPPQAVPVSSGVGKPTAIYLNLVGEGLPVLRSVQAEHLGKDYYLIVEPVPPGETWQFQPGQVVRCQKRNLSSGKALVAVEEAPRAS